jgi:hypothetical protein
MQPPHPQSRKWEEPLGGSRQNRYQILTPIQPPRHGSKKVSLTLWGALASRAHCLGLGLGNVLQAVMTPAVYLPLSLGEREEQGRTGVRKNSN